MINDPNVRQAGRDAGVDFETELTFDDIQAGDELRVLHVSQNQMDFEWTVEVVEAVLDVGFTKDIDFESGLSLMRAGDLNEYVFAPVGATE